MGTTKDHDTARRVRHSKIVQSEPKPEEPKATGAEAEAAQFLPCGAVTLAGRAPALTSAVWMAATARAVLLFPALSLHRRVEAEGGLVERGRRRTAVPAPAGPVEQYAREEGEHPRVEYGPGRDLRGVGVVPAFAAPSVPDLPRRRQCPRPRQVLERAHAPPRRLGEGTVGTRHVEGAEEVRAGVVAEHRRQGREEVRGTPGRPVAVLEGDGTELLELVRRERRKLLLMRKSSGPASLSFPLSSLPPPDEVEVQRPVPEGQVDEDDHQEVAPGVPAEEAAERRGAPMPDRDGALVRGGDREVVEHEERLFRESSRGVLVLDFPGFRLPEAETRTTAGENSPGTARTSRGGTSPGRRGGRARAPSSPPSS
ncbi:hypothetical protein THAOC_30728, partial [Thalassiosira oceanica]